MAPLQGMYELRSGSADVAIEYPDQAIRSEPEDEILFIMRCKCLIKYDVKSSEEYNMNLMFFQTGKGIRGYG